MSIPPIPPPFDHLANRPFSFFPAILNIEHNEWYFRRATWSEFLVVNAKTEQELWIPRRFLGEAARIEDPHIIVGLNKELEFKAGTVWPYQRRLIEMPVAVGSPVASGDAEGRSEPAPVLGIRVEAAESRLSRLILGAMLGVALLLGGVVMFSREGTLRPRQTYANKDQDFLGLRYQDDYHGVILKLGPPAEDRARQAAGDIHYRALWFPQRDYTIVLMGGDSKDLHYIGALDKNWNVV
ncbi:MAG: hypothetical protein ACRD96_23925, partial [Bryobacteraceae bacterium]